MAGIPDDRYEIVVIAYLSRIPLTAFLESLGAGASVLVVNNSAETDDLKDLGHRFPNVRIVDAGGNLGFSAGANLGARHSTAENLIFMNPDTLPDSDELGRMIDVLETADTTASCGAAGIGTAGGGAEPTAWRVMAHSMGLHRVFPTVGIYFYPKHGDRVSADWISGSCLAIRRADFDAIGGFDESYFVFMSDFDLGRKLRLAGRSQILLGDVTVLHLDGGSSDMPSEWTWNQRGKGWAQYVRRTMQRRRQIAVGLLLLAGYFGRFAFYTVTRRSLKATELATYSRAFISEWRAPDESGY